MNTNFLHKEDLDGDISISINKKKKYEKAISQYKLFSKQNNNIYKEKTKIKKLRKI